MQPIPLTDLIPNWISWGCHALDIALGGGIRTGMITELVGEPAAAKSQLCLQLLQTVQLPYNLGGLEGGALYIYTEGDPPLRRLRAMAENKQRHVRLISGRRLTSVSGSPTLLTGRQGTGLGTATLENIYVEKGAATPDELLATLMQARSLFAQPPNRPVRLIVIDSVANIFRDMGDNPGATELAQRASQLFKMSNILKAYADEYRLAVVVVNQVTDVIDSEGKQHTGRRLVSSGREVAPALGLAWSHCVNTRLFASRVDSAADDGGLLRRLQVVLSPYLPPCHCHFRVDDAGIQGVEAPPPTLPFRPPSVPLPLPSTTPAQRSLSDPPALAMQPFANP